jgi:NAD(P)-dependent dehydrogenase (short-subunit alcohol dehydrogenase family)
VLASLRSAAAFELDVPKEGAVERALAGTVERFGRIDSRRRTARPVMELDRATWQHVIDTNLTGAFLCTKHASRQMKTQGAGKIINISSIYGVIAPSKGLQIAYTVTKHAVIGLCERRGDHRRRWLYRQRRPRTELTHVRGD